MSECSFNRLVQFVDERLDLDGQLEVYSHLDRCEICRDAVYDLLRDRNKTLCNYHGHRRTPSVLLRRAQAAPGFLRQAR